MAGELKINEIQLGDSATASNNFVLRTNVDGTMTLARGNVGATTQDILKVNALGRVTSLLTTVRTVDSAPYTAVSGELLQIPHGLSFTPSSARLIFECLVADAGYSVGDRVHVTGYWNVTNSSPNQVSVDATNCQVKNPTGFNSYILNKTTGAGATPTATRWKYYFEVTP